MIQERCAICNKEVNVSTGWFRESTLYFHFGPCFDRYFQLQREKKEKKLRQQNKSWFQKLKEYFL